jgi:hypothetical protein
MSMNNIRFPCQHNTPKLEIKAKIADHTQWSNQMCRTNACKPSLSGPLDKNTMAAYDNDDVMTRVLKPGGKIKKVNTRPSNNIGTGNNIQNSQFSSSRS